MAVPPPAPPHDPSMPFRGGTKPAKPAKAKRAKATPTQRGTATGPTPPPVSPPLTDAQQIAAWVKAAQLPQLQALQEAERQSQAQSAAQVAQTQGYYKALAGLLAGIGPETQQTYSAAAGAEGAFGKGFSDGLAHVQGQMQDQSSDALNVAGAPASQAAEVTQSIGGTGATDALYGSGGYIPATTLNREGAAFTAAANRLPATAAGQGAQAIQALIGQQQTNDKGFDQQFKDLAAQVPGLTMQYQQQLSSQKSAAQDYAEKVREFDIGQENVAKQRAYEMYVANGDTPANRARVAAETGYDPVTGKPTAATLRENRIIAQWNAKQKQAQNTVSASLSGHAGYFVRSDGTPVYNKDGSLHLLPGYKIQNGNVVKTTTTGVGKPLTSGQVLTFLKGLSKFVKQPVLDTQGNQVLDSNGKVKYETVTQYRIPYKQAYNTLIGTGMSDKNARTRLNTIYGKGEGGRDWLTNEQQHVLSKAGENSVTDPITIPDPNSPGSTLDRVYITAAQAKALRAARKLPNGFWYTAKDKAGTSHTVWVLKPSGY